MKTHTDPREAISEIKNDLSKLVQTAVLELLERKHMYQSVVANVSSIVGQHRLSPPKWQKEYIDDRFEDAANWPWYLQEKGRGSVSVLGSEIVEIDEIEWDVPHIKTYCTKCKRKEPYNLASARNLLHGSSDYAGGIQTDKGTVEYYILSYVCQSCRGVPEVFIIRRLGNRLSLVGRGPMEHVEVPKEIPDEVKKFYSGAVVAYQSGQSLSGVFMLRTLIEQWARLFATTTNRADAILDEYMESLPTDFRGRQASMKDLYSTLSAAIHAAEASNELFESSIVTIAKHFRAREAYDLASLS